MLHLYYCITALILNLSAFLPAMGLITDHFNCTLTCTFNADFSFLGSFTISTDFIHYRYILQSIFIDIYLDIYAFCCSLFHPAFLLGTPFT